MPEKYSKESGEYFVGEWKRGQGRNRGRLSFGLRVPETVNLLSMGIGEKRSLDEEEFAVLLVMGERGRWKKGVFVLV